MIKYHIVPRKKPGTTEVKWYAAPKRQGVVLLNDLAEEMALESTITEHDIKAVISSLQQHIIKHLKNGNSVRLGDLGSFHITMSGSGSEVKKEYVLRQNLKAVRVQFSKSARFLRAFNLKTGNLQFEQIDAA